MKRTSVPYKSWMPTTILMRTMMRLGTNTSNFWKPQVNCYFLRLNGPVYPYGTVDRIPDNYMYNHFNRQPDFKPRWGNFDVGSSKKKRLLKLFSCIFLNLLKKNLCLDLRELRKGPAIQPEWSGILMDPIRTISIRCRTYWTIRKTLIHWIYPFIVG